MIANDILESSIKDRLSENNFLNDLKIFEEIDSTNEFIKQRIDDMSDKTLVVAEMQNSGKGSKGRSWSSPAGSGIWMSLLLRPDIPMSKAPMLTLVMAVSVARACRNMYNLPVEIKWPNDIVYNGKKICGILTEMKQIDADNYGIIVGVGVNVNTKEFPKELECRATSILIEMGVHSYRADLIAEIIKCFSDDYEVFLKYGDLSGLLRTYNSMSATIGKNVCVLDSKGEYNAVALSVGSDGHLLVQRENKQTKETETIHIIGDEVSVRGIYGYT